MRIKHEARCHCGALSLSCEGEPEEIVQCHCASCQRRTGTAFNLAAWYNRKDVTITGVSHQYVRKGDLGLDTEFHFCPICGSNMYWLSSDPNMVGIAVGCFADADFGKPTVVLYDSCRHFWLGPVQGVPTYATNGEAD